MEVHLVLYHSCVRYSSPLIIYRQHTYALPMYIHSTLANRTLFLTSQYLSSILTFLLPRSRAHRQQFASQTRRNTPCCTLLAGTGVPHPNQQQRAVAQGQVPELGDTDRSAGSGGGGASICAAPHRQWCVVTSQSCLDPASASALQPPHSPLPT